MKKALLLNAALIGAVAVSSLSARSLDTYNASDRAEIGAKQDQAYVTYESLGLNPKTGAVEKESTPLSKTSSVLTSALKEASVKKFLADKKVTNDELSKKLENPTFAAELVHAIVASAQTDVDVAKVLTAEIKTAIEAKAAKAIVAPVVPTDKPVAPVVPTDKPVAPVVPGDAVVASDAKPLDIAKIPTTAGQTPEQKTASVKKAAELLTEDLDAAVVATPVTAPSFDALSAEAKAESIKKALAILEAE